MFIGHCELLREVVEIYFNIGWMTNEDVLSWADQCSTILDAPPLFGPMFFIFMQSSVFGQIVGLLHTSPPRNPGSALDSRKGEVLKDIINSSRAEPKIILHTQCQCIQNCNRTEMSNILAHFKKRNSSSFSI